MNNFKEDILEIVGDELNNCRILVFNSYYLKDIKHNFPNEKLGVIHKLKDIINLFDYDFYSGYGGQECHNIIIYTPTRIIKVHEYDGSTYLYDIYLTPELHLKNKKEYIQK